jgi:hypothetical protein
LRLTDVLPDLVPLRDRRDVDLVRAGKGKLRANAGKYPVEKARGRKQ